MQYIRHIAVALGLIAALGSMRAEAVSLEDQLDFAAKMQRLRHGQDYDYARAAMIKYLELVPDAAAIKRELAHNYMKTSAVSVDGLVEYRYPDDSAKKIIDLLDQAIAITPDDHEALALLVYTHALQGNVALGQQALDKATALEKKADWLGYNSALLAISDNRLLDAVDLLSVIAVDKILPKGRDAGSIYSSAWATLRRLALSDAKLDTLSTVREGLATRLNIRELPEFMLNDDPSGSPILFHFSSQDKNCGYCINELPKFHQFAQRNKEQGDKYRVIYISMEPWNNINKNMDILTSVYVKGLPKYVLANQGTYIAVWGSSNPEFLTNMLDNYDEFLANGNMIVKAGPRAMYSHDYMLKLFNAYKKSDKEEHKAMAFTINGNFWAQARKYGYKTQDAADTAALASCQSIVDNKNKDLTCTLYARGNTIVDSAALKRKTHRESMLKKIKRRGKRVKKQRLADKQLAQKQTRNSSDKNAIVASNNSNQATGSNSRAKNNDNNGMLTSLGDPKTVSEAVRLYEKIDAHFKALAIAQDGDEFLTGFVSKEITQHRANQKALANCNAALQETEMGADCLLRSIGKSEVTDHSDKSIQKLTARQQRKNAKNSALSISYKKYRKFSDDKAYAITADANGNWTYGMAFGKRGPDKATVAALAECESKRADKNLPDKCQILILNSKFVEQVE